MGTSQQFSLRWNNYLKHITSAFDTLRSDEDLVDVTLSCEGKRIRAHKMLLSACSTYFRDLFKENPCQHPVIIFRNVKFDDLAALVDFIYQGEVNVVQEQLDSFMTTAELLAVQGLTDGSRKDDGIIEDDVEIPSEPEVQLRNASGKIIMNDKGNKSSSPSPYHSTESQKSETAPPPNKRRRCRENSNAHSEKSNRHTSSSKDSEQSKPDGQTTADPVEIIPLVPNLKLEMPEYLEQDGSSCSYEDQGENSNKMLDDSSDLLENDQKPDITQTFYSNQSSTDNLDVSKSSDIGYLLSKPGTSSGDRISHEAIQEATTQASEWGTRRRPSAAEQQQQQQQQAAVARWVCDVCGKCYSRGDSLAHHRSIHRGDTVCPICQAVFTRKYTMRCHLVNIHGAKSVDSRSVVVEQPSHSCKLCGKSFWNRDSMYKHMNMHKGTTQCPVCHKVLSRTTHMKRHLKNRHGWLGVGSNVASAATAAASATTSGSITLTTSATGAAAANVAAAPCATQQPVDSGAATFTTIRIRESSVERITSSPIP